jgi:hypothetical protein
MACATPKQIVIHKQIITQDPQNVTVFNKFIYLFMLGRNLTVMDQFNVSPSEGSKVGKKKISKNVLLEKLFGVTD